MSKKYILSFAPHLGVEAGAIMKPKQDIIRIAENLGFEQVLRLEELYYNILNSPNYVTSKSQIFKRLRRKYIQNQAKANNINKLKTFLNTVTTNDIIFLQYPMYGWDSPEIFKLLFEELPKVKAKTKIILIHDLESFDRNLIKYISEEEEHTFINSFDHAILHNAKMINYVKQENSKTKFHDLGIFDYLMDDQMNSEQISPIKNSIFYAGALNKSLFLEGVGTIPSYDFHVYGRKYEFQTDAKNLLYKGELDPVDVIKEGTKCAYGLVWNGHDIHGLSGPYGKYMEINNPYKFSCNVASGLPTITSKSAGIAQFIKDQNVGLIVDSLEELNNLRITEQEYEQMKTNTLKLREKIIKGEITENILKKCME